MLVHIPTHLEAYTGGVREIELAGATLDEVLQALDAEHKGIRFRFITEQGEVREHFHIFVDGKLVKDLSLDMSGKRELHIIAALSGG